MFHLLIFLIVTVGLIGMATILLLMSRVPIVDNGWFQLGVLALFGVLYYTIVSHFGSVGDEDFPFAHIGISVNLFVATAFAAITNVPFVAYVIVSCLFRGRDALMGDRGPIRTPGPDSAELAEKEGDFIKAEELLLSAVQEKPDDMETRLRLAKLYLKMGNMRNAVLQLGRVAESKEEEHSFPAAIELAELALDGKVSPDKASRALSMNLCDFPRSLMAERAKELLRLLGETRQGG